MCIKNAIIWPGRIAKRTEEGKGIHAMKHTLSGTKMLLLQGCEILPLGKSVLMCPQTRGRPAESWGSASGLLGLPVPALRQSPGLGIAVNFFCVTAVKALIAEAASHQHPLDCWNRIRASDWKQMAQAEHEATLCMEQMLRMTSSSAYAHYRYSFILIYSLQKRNSEHKSSNSSLTLPESALT